MASRLPGQISISGVVFFGSKSLLGVITGKILTRKHRSHVRILLHQTWPVNEAFHFNEQSLNACPSKWSLVTRVPRLF